MLKEKRNGTKHNETKRNEKLALKADGLSET